jgi:peptide/nickel transport system substrate-binding protein
MFKKVLLTMAFVLALPLALAACAEPQVMEVTREVVITETITETVTEIVDGEEVVVEVTRVIEVPVETEVDEPVAPAVDRMGAWVDTVIVVEEPSADGAVSRLDAGDIDIYTFGIAVPETFARIEASANLHYVRAFGNYDEFSFNTYGPIFDNGNLNPFAIPRIREAMNWLVDREFIAEEIYGGMAVPRYTALNTVSNDYALLADVVRAVELQYAHNPELAQEVITEEMEALGAELVGGIWHYEGEPVELSLLIRTEDTRLQTGDYLGNVLEDVGFTVIRDYRTAADAGPIWVDASPSEGLMHVYTGGWVSTAVSRDLGGNFAFFYTDMGLPWPLWQAYENDPEFYELADRLDNNDFRTIDERRELMARALDLSMAESQRIFVVDRAPVFPIVNGVSIGSDLSGGPSGSAIWPYTVRRDGEIGGSVRMASASILTNPWNPLGGSNWIFDQMLVRGTSEFATNPDPFTGLAWPQRIERAEVFVEEGLPVGITHDWVTLEFVSGIEVPDDAWVDWDAAEQRFLTAGEVFTETRMALTRNVVYYPDDLYDTVAYHDGSPFSVADVVMTMILQFDRAKEESAIHDPATVAAFNSFMSGFRGVRILSEDPLVIETYRDNFTLDAEQNINTWWPHYSFGPGSWHALALGILADANEEAAFTNTKAGALEVEHLSYIAGPTLEVLSNQLAFAQEEGWIPYEPTLGQYITAEEASSRYANLAEWNRTRGHFWIGTGPFYLERAFPVEGTVILQRNTAYPDPADKWDRFAAPPVPQVELDGPTRVTVGESATFDVFIEFEGQPYPVDDIREVKYLVLDATNALIHVGEATAEADGVWSFTLDEDVTAALEAGSNRLEVVAVSYLIAFPGTDSLLFVTAP